MCGGQRAGPGVCLQHKAVFLSLPRIEIYLSCTHRGRRLNLEMWSPTSFSADGSFHLLFQQDIPPMLLRTPPACPAAQPYGLYLLFQHSSGHPCGDSSVNHRCRGPDGRAMEEVKIGREETPSENFCDSAYILLGIFGTSTSFWRVQRMVIWA